MKITFNFLDGDVQTFSTSKSKIIIGRSPKADIVVTQEGFSRQHCQIELVDGEVFVTDLDSANGIFIDSKKIEPNERVSYNTFLPMSFGPTKNIEIDPESATQVGMMNPFKESSQPVAHTHNASQVTKRMPSASTDPARRTNDISKKEKPASKPKLDTDKKSKLLNILIVIGLIAFGAYYLTNKEDTPDMEIGGGEQSAPKQNSGKSDTVDF